MEDRENNSDKILKHIQENPGCQLRQIKRKLGISIGTVQYHLNILEKTGRIVSEKNNFQRCFFIAGLFKDNERNILRILNQDTARRILMYILERKHPTQTEIVENIKISAPSVNWHVKRLTDLGIIFESRDGKYRRYQLAINSTLIVNLVKNYHPSLWVKWSDRLAEMFLSLTMDGKE